MENVSSRLLFGLCVVGALGAAGCSPKTELVCGFGLTAVDGHCVATDSGVVPPDLGLDAGPADASDGSTDAQTDMPDMPDLGPVFTLDPCTPDGGATQNTLHVEGDPGSTLFVGTADVAGGVWTQTATPSMGNRLTVETADLSDAGADAGVDAGPYWRIVFAGPSTSAPLAPGRYEGAVRATATPPSPPAPTMDISYNGVSCSALTGRFELTTIDSTASGGYTHVRGTFEQTCGGMPGNTLRGCIVYSP